jgi:hypothetical protein
MGKYGNIDVFMKPNTDKCAFLLVVHILFLKHDFHSIQFSVLSLFQQGVLLFVDTNHSLAVDHTRNFGLFSFSAFMRSLGVFKIVSPIFLLIS